MSSTSILVLGAGELGNAVIDALTSHSKRGSDVAIAVLLRSSTIHSQDAQKKSQNERLLSLGVTLEAGDIESASVAELAQIFGKYHTIVSCTGMYLAPGSQLKLTRAVLEAGVSRYFPWQYGIDYDVVGGGSAQDLFDEQLEVRNLLRSSSSSPTSVDWIIVSTGVFMSFLLVPDFGPVDMNNRVLRGLGSWDTPVSATTPHDIGRMVAELVYDPRDISRQVVYVAGDTVTYGQVADLVEARFGGSWTRELWDLDFLRMRLQAEPDNGMVKYQNVFAAGKGVAWNMSKTINWQRGIDMEDLKTYLKNTNA
ncbi:hypothetical protein G7054_g5550 [Neopestalotiopsis clavispora]|nr:hypothetical protein G7054_g5550 [Neopestalotiopsis clavispora]